tara:strand:- start:1577 stop:2047 length:471 start_codon:yes stop_codon:yes gene_type:complete
MTKKFLLIICFFFSLTNCGYSPIYSQKTDSNFSITNLEIDGNFQMKNIIESRLNMSSVRDSSKKYELEINTFYDRVSIVKDMKGTTTDLKLVANLNYSLVKSEINTMNLKENGSFSESIIIKKKENNYEQNNYERIVIKSLSEQLANKLIFYLSNN